MLCLLLFCVRVCPTAAGLSSVCAPRCSVSLLRGGGRSSRRTAGGGRTSSLDLHAKGSTPLRRRPSPRSRRALVTSSSPPPRPHLARRFFCPSPTTPLVSVDCHCDALSRLSSPLFPLDFPFFRFHLLLIDSFSPCGQPHAPCEALRSPRRPLACAATTSNASILSLTCFALPCHDLLFPRRSSSLIPRRYYLCVSASACAPTITYYMT